ncbi:RNA polymerase II transcription factor SIII subunit A-domain-containing protein [Truncatella angustata]|uniref:RNA polymerase II transcription factor SIII subunit A-domain-containing protein n=1 Tax=Truncatella angustata TaxID=152316 RepID=A0A9P8UXI2_9PEZI|nr:RNA polymerase II transcription factor SIII subunit A-domain-containing protein [Truncatella angustata]KAH6660356.1 RNA polymerase II transcription factor SIII subunit A-domain-containing protein [Truncatella angustata]KAH8201871.1 hypothetical protein TruAng_003958 [Truncatella angustata]
MAVKSLADLCTAVCIKNIREIQDVGGLPYHIVRPILMRLDSAAQLRAIEEASPHIALDNEECWQRLIRKNFAGLHAQHDFAPRNPASWHKVYAKYAKINADAKAEAEAKLKAAFAGIQKKKAENTSSIEHHRSLPRPPRDTKNVGRKAAVGRRGGSNDTGELKFTGGSRTKTNTAASVMRRVKREAAEVSARNKLATPNGALQVRQGQIRAAPKGMVHEQAVKHNPAIKVQPPAVRTMEDDFRDHQMEQREARLRKLKAQGANILEDSDVDDDDEDNGFGGGGGRGGLNVEELEDLFDDDEPPRRPAPLPAKKKGILSNAYRGPPATVQKVSVGGGSSASRSTAEDSSSRPAQSAHGPSGSPEPKPRMPVKRKAANVFMAPRSKVQRR